MSDVHLKVGPNLFAGGLPAAAPGPCNLATNRGNYQRSLSSALVWQWPPCLLHACRNRVGGAACHNCSAADAQGMPDKLESRTASASHYALCGSRSTCTGPCTACQGCLSVCLHCLPFTQITPRRAAYVLMAASQFPLRSSFEGSAYTAKRGRRGFWCATFF